MRFSGKLAALLCAIGLLFTSCGEQKPTTSQDGSSSTGSSTQTSSSESGMVTADTSGENVKLGQARVITVADVSGEVEVTNEGKTTAAFVGQRLKVGDQVSTKADGRITVKLDEGDLFTLSEDTVAAIEEASANSGNTRTVLKLVRGTVVNNVQSLSAGSDYLIKTSNTTMGVRGTVFAVYLKAESSTPKLLVAEGAVAAVEGGEEQLSEGTVVPANSQLEVTGEKIAEVKENAEKFEKLDLKELPDSAKESLVVEWLQRTPTDTTSIEIIQEALRENPEIATHIPSDLLTALPEIEQTASGETGQQTGGTTGTAPTNQIQPNNTGTVQNPVNPVNPVIPESVKPEPTPPPAVNMDIPNQPTDPRPTPETKEPEKPTEPSKPEKPEKPVEPSKPDKPTPTPDPNPGGGDTGDTGDTGGGGDVTPSKPKLGKPKLDKETVKFTPKGLTISVQKQASVGGYELTVGGKAVTPTQSENAKLNLKVDYTDTPFYGEAVITLKAIPANPAEYDPSEVASYTTVVADEGKVVAASPINWKVSFENGKQLTDGQGYQIAVVPSTASYDVIKSKLVPATYDVGGETSTPKVILANNPTQPLVTEPDTYCAYIALMENGNLLRLCRTESVKFDAEQELKTEVKNAVHEKTDSGSSIKFDLSFLPTDGTDGKISIGDFFADDADLSNKYAITKKIVVTGVAENAYTTSITGTMKTGYAVTLTAIGGATVGEDSKIDIDFSFKTKDEVFTYTVDRTEKMPLITPEMAQTPAPTLTSTQVKFTLREAVPKAVAYTVEVWSTGDDQTLLASGHVEVTDGKETIECPITSESPLAPNRFYQVKIIAKPADDSNFAASAPLTIGNLSVTV